MCFFFSFVFISFWIYWFILNPATAVTCKCYSIVFLFKIVHFLDNFFFLPLFFPVIRDCCVEGVAAHVKIQRQFSFLFFYFWLFRHMNKESISLVITESHNINNVLHCFQIKLYALGRKWEKNKKKDCILEIRDDCIEKLNWTKSQCFGINRFVFLHSVYQIYYQ